MPDTPRSWRLDRNAPVRADADSMFIPTSELPGASIGDRITISEHDGDAERIGTVVEFVPDAHLPSLRLVLDGLPTDDR